MDAMLHVELDLEPGVEPITGWMTTPSGRRAFSGYLELLASLERILSGAIGADDLREVS